LGYKINPSRMRVKGFSAGIQRNLTTEGTESTEARKGLRLKVVLKQG